MICIRDKSLRRMAQRVLFSAGVNSVTQDSLSQCLETERDTKHPILLYSIETFEQLKQEQERLEQLVSQSNRMFVVYLLHEPNRQIIARLLSSTPAANIIAPLDTEDLFVSLRKILTGNIFGIEKYLAWGTVQIERNLLTSEEKSATIDTLREFVIGQQNDRSLVEAVCTVADEFLMNAFFDAPHDSDGKARYQHFSRAERIVLEAGEVISLRYGSDGHRLAVSCRDPFGMISSEMVLGQLTKCLGNPLAEVSQGTGGAGVGLFMIYNYVTNLVVNIEAGSLTEFIGIFDLQASRKELRARTKGLSLFKR